MKEFSFHLQLRDDENVEAKVAEVLHDLSAAREAIAKKTSAMRRDDVIHTGFHGVVVTRPE